MTSRRTFLKLSSLSAVAAGSATLSAQPASAPPGGPLPPSIASLTSMKAQATPITVAERRARVEKARQLMATAGIDALLLTGGTSLVYFANVRWWTSERFFGIVIPTKGTPFVVCPAFEEDRAREQLALGPFADADLRTWEEHEDPYARVRDALKDRGLATGALLDHFGFQGSGIGQWLVRTLSGEGESIFEGIFAIRKRAAGAGGSMAQAYGWGKLRAWASLGSSTGAAAFWE